MDAPIQPTDLRDSSVVDLKKENKKPVNESQALKEIGPDFLELFDRVENVLKLAASIMMDEKDPVKAKQKLIQKRQEFLEKKREEIKARPIMLEAAQKQPRMLEYFIESHLSQMRAEFDYALVSQLLDMKSPKVSSGAEASFFFRIEGSGRFFNGLLETLKNKNETAYKSITRKTKPYAEGGWGRIKRETDGGGFAIDAALSFIGAESYTGDIKELFDSLEETVDPAENTEQKLNRIKKDPQAWAQETMNKKHRTIREQITKMFAQEGSMIKPTTMVYYDQREVEAALVGYEDVLSISGTGKMTIIRLK